MSARLIKEIWRDKIYDSIIEYRNDYQVVYNPLNLQFQNFATLNLNFNSKSDLNQIISTMEKEMGIWLKKYPVPIMATSFFNENEMVIDLSSIKESNNLYGAIMNDKIEISWNDYQVKLSEKFYDMNITNKIYKSLVFTSRECKESYAKEYIINKKKIKKPFDIGIVIWLISSITILILGFTHMFVGVLALVYSLYMTIRKYLKFRGIYTKKEILEKKKQTLMRHYFYHCELNPEGFLKLKFENLKK